MLNINRCRRILGSVAPESDTELARIRDALHALARVIVERLPQFGPCARAIRRCPMLTWLGTLRIQLKPSCPMLRNGLLSFPVSLARQQIIDTGNHIRDFDPEPYQNK